MEALDGRVRLLLHQVLHHDQAKELGFFFQVGSVKNKISKISTVVLSWWCLTVLNYSVLYLIVLHLTLVQNVTYFPILIWQKWTKCWIKVVIICD